MNTKILVVVFLLCSTISGFAQRSDLIHEAGIFVGPQALFSDFGQRFDWETNSSNVGINFGIFHVLNFVEYGRPSYFTEHFKIRTELSYSRTTLNFYGEYVADNKTSFFSDQLRATEGVSKIFEFGPQIEYYPFDIRDYMYGQPKVAPYLSFGVHYVNFNPEVKSNIKPSLNTHPKYIGSFQQDSGSTAALLGGLGLKYQLDRSSDIFLSSRWGYYFSDWVDGLNPTLENNGGREVPENQSNDWTFALSIGYIYVFE